MIFASHFNLIFLFIHFTYFHYVYRWESHREPFTLFPFVINYFPMITTSFRYNTWWNTSPKGFKKVHNLSPNDIFFLLSDDIVTVYWKKSKTPKAIKWEARCYFCHRYKVIRKVKNMDINSDEATRGRMPTRCTAVSWR